MILTSHTRIGWLPLALAIAGLSTAAMVLFITILDCIDEPIVNVPGSMEFRDEVRPMRIDEEYTKAVAKAFCMRMQSYNRANFTMNRKIVLQMAHDQLIPLIQKNNIFMSTVIENFDQSAQVSIKGITAVKIGDLLWEVKLKYMHEVFDAGVPRMPENRIMTMIINEKMPKAGDIYAVRISNLDDRVLSETIPLTVPNP